MEICSDVEVLNTIGKWFTTFCVLVILGIYAYRGK